MRTDLPWDGILSDDNVRVTVNGKRWPVRSVKIQKGMRDGHPAAKGVLNGAWCIEASIEWAQERNVDTQVPQPFTDDSGLLSGEELSVPRAGDEVTIATGEGSAFFGVGIWFQQVKGVIDKTTGSFADGTASSTVVDRIEELDRDVQYSALLADMVPVDDSSPIRYQGLQSAWYVDRVLKDESQGTLGWSVAPKLTWETLCAVTSPGSLRPPERGTIVSVTDKDTSDGWTWRADSDGAPWGTRYTADYNLSADDNDFVITASFPWSESQTSGIGRVRVRDASGAGVSVEVRDTGVIAVNWTGHGTQTVPRNGATRAALWFHRTSQTSQDAILRLDDGREFTYSTTTGSMPANWRGDRVVVDTDFGVGWWVVEGTKPAANRWACLNYKPTARVRIDDYFFWTASRDQSRQTAADWLGKQMEAECASMWLDELGVMQWAGRGVLEKQPTHQTITSSLTVDDVSWALDRTAGARRVTIQYLHPRVQMGYQGACTEELWSSDTMDAGPGDPATETVTVPDDQDWLAEDLNPHHIKSWGGSWDWHNAHSSFGGIQYRKSDSDEAVWAEFLNCSMVKTGLRDYEITFAAWESMSSAYRVKSTYPPNTGAFVRVGSGPLHMRGRARVIWSERETTVSTGAPAGAPARFVHDVGWRVHDRGSAITDLLDYLRTELASPPPVITSIVCEHDPRRQIGDHLRIEDPHVTGAWIEMLVQEQDVDIDPGTLTDTLRGRVTGFGLLTGISTSQRPATHTAITPVTNWMREVA